MNTICHTLLIFSGYAIKSNSDNSNILLLNFYELCNIFSYNFKFQFHKYIFTIYLRETKYRRTNRNMHFNIHITLSSNYMPFHATMQSAVNTQKELINNSLKPPRHYYDIKTHCVIFIFYISRHK